MNRHEIVQPFLKSQRYWVISEFVKALPREASLNWYYKREYRNKYEIDRIWDRKLERTVTSAREHVDRYPFLAQIPGRLLVRRIEDLKKLNLMNTGIARVICDEIVEKKRGFSSFRDNMEADSAAAKLDREYEFVRCIQHIMFELEKVEEDNP